MHAAVMNIKNLADDREWDLSEIGVLAPHQRDQLDEEALHIEEALDLAVEREGFAHCITVMLNLYYSPGADVLCWPDPPALFYPGGILFNSYPEFLSWMAGRLLAMKSSPSEVDRVVGEMEGWRMKALTGRSLPKAADVASGRVLTSEVELL